METAGPPARAPTVRASTGSAARFPALPRPRFSSPRPSFLRTRGSRRLLRNLRGPSATASRRLHTPAGRASITRERGRSAPGTPAAATRGLPRPHVVASDTWLLLRTPWAERQRPPAARTRPRPAAPGPRAADGTPTLPGRPTAPVRAPHARPSRMCARTHAPSPSRTSVTHALPRAPSRTGARTHPGPHARLSRTRSLARVLTQHPPACARTRALAHTPSHTRPKHSCHARHSRAHLSRTLVTHTP